MAPNELFLLTLAVININSLFFSFFNLGVGERDENYFFFFLNMLLSFQFCFFIQQSKQNDLKHSLFMKLSLLAPLLGILCWMRKGGEWERGIPVVNSCYFIPTTITFCNIFTKGEQWKLSPSAIPKGKKGGVIWPCGKVEKKGRY